ALLAHHPLGDLRLDALLRAPQLLDQLGVGGALAVACVAVLLRLARRGARQGRWNLLAHGEPFVIDRPAPEAPGVGRDRPRPPPRAAFCPGRGAARASRAL